MSLKLEAFNKDLRLAWYDAFENWFSHVGFQYNYWTTACLISWKPYFCTLYQVWLKSCP